MHPKVLSEKAWSILRALREAGVLEGWTLAGGTGFALQIGHRYSEDLDLFQPDEFDPDPLLNRLTAAGAVQVQDRSRSTLHALVDSVRFSFLQCRPPLLFEGIAYRGLTVADLRDIAVMKLVAIGGRGSRKDFVDLYFYLNSTGSLEAAFDLMRRRFTGIDYNEYHLMKSLVYFEDAENEPMPEMIRRIDWKEVKRFILSQVRRLSP